MSSQSASLLIALPKGFGFHKLFAQKIENLLSSVAIGQVTIMQDNLSIGATYFSSKEISVTHVDAFTKLSIKKKLSKFSHIIIFWDGEDLTDLVFTAKLQKKLLRIVPVEITKIRNKDKDEPFDVYIGRGTPWGNPFPIAIGTSGDSRDDVIRKYREYFQSEFLGNPEKHRALLSLRGYRLACHCKPLACHGDIIAAYLNSYEEDNGAET